MSPFIQPYFIGPEVLLAAQTAAAHLSGSGTAENTVVVAGAIPQPALKVSIWKPFVLTFTTTT